MITTVSKASFKKDATIICLTEESVKQKKFPFQNVELKETLSELDKRDIFKGAKGHFFTLTTNDTLVFLVGIGKTKDLEGTYLRQTVRQTLLHPLFKKSKSCEVLTSFDSKEVASFIVEGILIGGYIWQKYKTGSDKTPALIKKNYAIQTRATQKYINDHVTICEGVNLARDLINDNADYVNSLYLEKKIKKIVKNDSAISLEILGEKEMVKKGLNLHLSVNKGSQYPPRLIIARYQGSRRKEAPYTAFVGKGLTYDTGGLNLKPTGFMETMKMDMSGTACVIGTLKNICALRPKKNILLVCAIAENAIDSKSYKPGDVIKSYEGKTVEIHNTDAEGRLVLADALAYVVKKYKPKHIIDAATLTGACVVALGYDYTGLMSNDEALLKELRASADLTDDRAWPLPIYPELKEHVRSKIADIKNGGLGRAAGTLSAGEFLRQFIGDTKWAHLDIAGSAFVDGAQRMYFGHGATGSGVRLMTNFLTKN